MRKCRGRLRYVCDCAIGVLEIDLSLLVWPELGECLNESRGVLADEPTLEVVVHGVHRRRIKPRLYDEVVLRPDCVLKRLAKALQRLKHLPGALGISGVDDVEVSPGRFILVAAETQINTEFLRCVRDERGIELDQVLGLRSWEANASRNYGGIERVEAIFK